MFLRFYKVLGSGFSNVGKRCFAMPFLIFWRGLDRPLVSPLALVLPKSIFSFRITFISITHSAAEVHERIIVERSLQGRFFLSGKFLSFTYFFQNPEVQKIKGLFQNTMYWLFGVSIIHNWGSKLGNC